MAPEQVGDFLDRGFDLRQTVQYRYNKLSYILIILIIRHQRSVYTSYTAPYTMHYNLYIYIYLFYNAYIAHIIHISHILYTTLHFIRTDGQTITRPPVCPTPPGTTTWPVSRARGG